MGKGNVSVHGPYEAVYYISNSFLHVYREDEPQEEAQHPFQRTAGGRNGAACGL